MTDDFRIKLDEAVRKLVAEQNIAIETLTQEQVAAAFKQAILCGDFTRMVRPDAGQAVVYLPYAKEQALQSRIKALHAALDGLLKHYVALVECGDCGKWDAEKEPVVIAAREALAM